MQRTGVHAAQTQISGVVEILTPPLFELGRKTQGLRILTLKPKTKRSCVECPELS